MQDTERITWLCGLYPIWARMTPRMIHTSALTAMAELLMSGCTASSDHLYLYPNGAKLDDTISAAQQIVMRFHAMRGSMSVGKSAGGLPPDCVVENQAAILKDSQRVVEHFHDANRYAMIRIDTPSMAGGAAHDPIAALMFCASPRAEYTILSGRVVVREGRLTTLELQPHIARHNSMARELANGY